MCTYVYMSAIGTAPCAVSNRESRYPPLGWDEELCRVYQEEIFAWYAQRVGRTDNTQIQARNPGLPSLRERISRSYGQARWLYELPGMATDPESSEWADGVKTIRIPQHF